MVDRRSDHTYAAATARLSCRRFRVFVGKVDEGAPWGSAFGKRTQGWWASFCRASHQPHWP